jgi:hypothetical protein
MRIQYYMFLFVFLAVSCQGSNVEVSIREAEAPPTTSKWTEDQQKIVTEVEQVVENAVVQDLWESGREPNYAEQGDKTWCVRLENNVDVWHGAQIKNTNRLIVYYTTNSQNIFKPIMIYSGDQRGWDFWDCS